MVTSGHPDSGSGFGRHSPSAYGAAETGGALLGGGGVEPRAGVDTPVATVVGVTVFVSTRYIRSVRHPLCGPRRTALPGTVLIGYQRWTRKGAGFQDGAGRNSGPPARRASPREDKGRRSGRAPRRRRRRFGKGGLPRATGAAPAAVDNVVVFLPGELIRPVRQRRCGTRRTAPPGTALIGHQRRP